LIKAVIFDVDGTLVDSNDLHVEAWREAGAVAVYRDVSDLLDNYEESPLAKGRADAAGGRS
jgi:beta-phosphoglucomutase-like phosphatase (HAD superfamily)